MEPGSCVTPRASQPGHEKSDSVERLRRQLADAISLRPNIPTKRSLAIEGSNRGVGQDEKENHNLAQTTRAHNHQQTRPAKNKGALSSTRTKPISILSSANGQPNNLNTNVQRKRNGVQMATSSNKGTRARGEEAPPSSFADFSFDIEPNSLPEGGER
eukprot:2399416-Rhodomonas_salina.3